jgi:uncharacterized membrane protein YsdA (DUF1294 family)
MGDLSIIVMVAIFALAGCAIMAFAVYIIDKNADRHDIRH